MYPPVYSAEMGVVVSVVEVGGCRISSCIALRRVGRRGRVEDI
jgi:hypothetical protein